MFRKVATSTFQVHGYSGRIRERNINNNNINIFSNTINNKDPFCRLYFSLLKAKPFSGKKHLNKEGNAKIVKSFFSV